MLCAASAVRCDSSLQSRSLPIKILNNLVWINTPAISIHNLRIPTDRPRLHGTRNTRGDPVLPRSSQRRTKKKVQENFPSSYCVLCGLRWDRWLLSPNLWWYEILWLGFCSRRYSFRTIFHPTIIHFFNALRMFRSQVFLLIRVNT